MKDCGGEGKGMEGERRENIKRVRRDMMVGVVGLVTVCQYWILCTGGSDLKPELVTFQQVFQTYFFIILHASLFNYKNILECCI